MAADDRLIEIVPELLEEIRSIKTELKDFRNDSNSRFEKLEGAMDKNTDELAKLRLSTSELRLSNLQLAREIEAVLDLDRRLKIVENIVLKNAS